MTLENRYDFVYLFDVVNGNPNGDPDAGNLPRLDPETNHGIVTDVCLKRKIRNYVAVSQTDDGAHPKPGYDIYVQEGSVLNRQHEKAYTALKVDSVKKELPKDKQKAAELTAWMCRNFFDIRAFGAVMSTEVNCGQVRGPVQVAFATSIEPIVPLEIAITRMASTNERDESKGRTIGRKFAVPYGLYRAHGFVSANLAARTEFSEHDLSILWEALANMFDHDRSASRGEMAARRLVIFKHDSVLGNAPAHKLFERVRVGRANAEGSSPARAYSDYEVVVDSADLPSGVTIIDSIT